MKMYHARGSYSASDLYPVQYGEEQCEGGHSFGPAIRNFYIIHYVYKGSGTLKIENKIYKIHEKQFFIIYPHCNAYYEADKDNPWEYGWLEFDGTASIGLVNEAGFSHDHHVMDDNGSVGEVLKSIIDCGMCRYSKLMSRVWSFFEATAENNMLRAAEQDNVKLYITDAESYIISRIHGNVTVNEVASYLNIDRSYLSRIFKQEKGMSPKQYIMAMKMEMAAESLKKANSSVKAAAAGIGYTAQQDFSKAFRKKYGMSPSEWRKKNRQ